jgi:hypothetical protein
MTQDEIIEMAKQAGMIYREFSDEFANGNTDGVDLETLQAFAKLVAERERKESQGRIETLYAMYELAVKQRDYLMDQQRAQVEAMRGRVQ